MPIFNLCIMKNTLTFLCLLVVPILLQGQSKIRWLDVLPNNSDCISAIEINLKDTIRTTASPKGHGQVLEFKNNDKKSLLYVEREHNTVWYQFEVDFNGSFTFELTPFSIHDDYDFMLFKYDNTVDFCQKLMDKKIEPIRTNISRNNKDAQSKTGLSWDFKDKMIHSGVGANYSYGLEVTKGDRYFLLVDNVYSNGKGHQLAFNYNALQKEADPLPKAVETVVEKVETKSDLEIRKSKILTYDLKGVVMDTDSNKPLKAEITLTDSNTGEVVASAQSDSLTGEYTLTLKDEAQKIATSLYTLEISKDSYFFDSQDIKPFELPELSKVKTQTRIPKIKKGEVYQIQNINFYGNEARPLPISYPVFKSLLRLMEKNPTLNIRIEGHTNGCHQNWDYSKELSIARAATVRNYLIENNIDEKRVEHDGFSCDKMIFPNPVNEKQNMLNRRVEIRIL
jgi:outer membrane protein OmpA-like peptidoglycan-associated protein